MRTLIRALARERWKQNRLRRPLDACPRPRSPPRRSTAHGPLIEVARRRPDIVQQLLLAMDLREAEGGLSSLELRFLNVATHERGGVDFAFEHSDTDLLALGTAIRVLAGDEGDPVEIFAGTISAVELVFEEGGQPELCIHAEDALMGQRMRRFTRIHAAGPLRDILEDLAAGDRPDAFDPRARQPGRQPDPAEREQPRLHAPPARRLRRRHAGGRRPSCTSHRAARSGAAASRSPWEASSIGCASAPISPTR